MDEMYKNFRIDIYNRLKSIVNASVNCVYHDDDDTLSVTISRLGLEYNTKVTNCSDVIMFGEDGIDKCLNRIVKMYRNYINHKFFY